MLLVDEHLEELSELLNQIPEDNYKVLSYLTEFQWRVIQHSDENLMTIQNLAVVFGPNLLRTENTQENTHLLVKDSSIVCKIMETIVLKKDSLFKRVFASPSKARKKLAHSTPSNRDAYASQKKNVRNASSPSLSSMIRPNKLGGESNSAELIPLKSPRSARGSRESSIYSPVVKVRANRGRKRPHSKAPSLPREVGEKIHTVPVTKAPTVEAHIQERPDMMRTRSNALSFESVSTTEDDSDISELDPSNVTIAQLLELLKEEREARKKLEERVAQLERANQS